MKRLLILSVAVLGLLVTEAQAQPFTPELEADYTAALAWWGVPSPPMCSSVTREVQPFSDSAVAVATVPSPDVTAIPCVLIVYANQFYALIPCVQGMTIRHEVGHLLGLHHSEDPNSIMNLVLNVPVWCPDFVIEESRRHLPQYWAEWRRERSHCRRWRRSHPRSICWRWVRSNAHSLHELAAG